MFDFGALPPEINSGRMYAGPGSGPMMIASAAWDVLAAELGTAASAYNSIIDELTNGPWVGPASTSMVAAITPYVTWLGAVGGQAEETAGHARAAAAAFEAAFAMTVPPPVIAANRVLLATLIATNFLGQNFPAIAATEAQYMEMWAQDAAAMYTYAAASTTASQMTPFAAPPQTTTPDGESQQFAAVSQATTQQAGNTAQTVAHTSSQMATPQALSATAPQTAAQQVSAAATAPTTTGTSLQDILPTPNTWWWQMGPGGYTAIIKQTLQAYFGVGIGNFGWSIGQQLTFGPGGATAGAGGAWFPTPAFAQLGLGNLGNAAGAVTASTGQAAQVGGLSVPQQWATLASTVSSADAAEAEAAPIQTVSATNPPGNALLRGMPTGAVGRRAGAAAGYSHKYGFRYSVLTRPPSAG
ncbi:PPE family protein [Mycobacterium sp. E3247]|uniref:PPE family protein n=1 Tax=Mycobacterium sp. E3247 TaxID=1856864 RepID=UPI0008006E56|nr:PPE family protein [Mycobacterium sp. E3247]OBH20450.1 hypothetical protein A9X04_06245 [Mycobacterium sp. E3247]